MVFHFKQAASTLLFGQCLKAILNCLSVTLCPAVAKETSEIPIWTSAGWQWSCTPGTARPERFVLLLLALPIHARKASLAMSSTSVFSLGTVPFSLGLSFAFKICLNTWMSLPTCTFFILSFFLNGTRGQGKGNKATIIKDIEILFFPL